MDGLERTGASDFRTGGRNSGGNEKKSTSLLDLNKNVGGVSDLRFGGGSGVAGGSDFRTGSGGGDFRTGGGGTDFRTGGGGTDFRTGGGSGVADFRTGGGASDFRGGGSAALRSGSSGGGGGGVFNRFSDSSNRSESSSRAKTKTLALPKPKIKIIRNQIKLRDYQIEELGKAFDIFDETGEGKMNIKDIKTVIRACGFEPTKDEIKTIIRECDPNSKGYLSKDDFIKLFMLKLAQKDPREEIERAFKFFDKSNNGYITFHDMKTCAKEIGEDLHDEEIQEMMDEADLDDDGTISLEEFIKMMTKTYYFD